MSKSSYEKFDTPLYFDILIRLRDHIFDEFMRKTNSIRHVLLVIQNTYPNLSNIVHTDFELGRVISTVVAADPGITEMVTMKFVLSLTWIFWIWIWIWILILIWIFKVSHEFFCHLVRWVGCATCYMRTRSSERSLIRKSAELELTPPIRFIWVTSYSFNPDSYM